MIERFCLSLKRHFAVLLGNKAADVLAGHLRKFKVTFGDRAYISFVRRFGPNEFVRPQAVAEAA